MSRVKPCLKFIPPQLPASTDEPPKSGEWVHEVKHDGYRTQIIVRRGDASAFTRNGHNWTGRYSGITDAAAGLPCQSAILDGEVVVQDSRGVSDFEALQKALSTGHGRLIWRRNRVWYTIDGHVDALEFEKRASEKAETAGPSFRPRRWFCDDSELVHANGKTYAFSNQWGGQKWLRAMNLLKEKYPHFGIDFSPET